MVTYTNDLAELKICTHYRKVSLLLIFPFKSTDYRWILGEGKLDDHVQAIKVSCDQSLAINQRIQGKIFEISYENFERLAEILPLSFAMQTVGTKFLRFCLQTSKHLLSSYHIPPIEDTMKRNSLKISLKYVFGRYFSIW